MAASVNAAITNPDADASNEALGQGQPARNAQQKNYKGFVAGVFSGIAKLSVGHPFDTIKVRLQTTSPAQFRGPVDCLLQTIRKEGPAGLYKGATPPLIGWMFMDSVMLGSLTLYRRLLQENVFTSSSSLPNPLSINSPSRPPPNNPFDTLPILGHGVAGIFAGWTVSLIASPVEHIKARLQTQYSSQKSLRRYRGPIDCTRQIYAHHGLRGLYHGLLPTLYFRSFFFVWWSSYALLTRALQSHTSLSTPAINFWAGGVSAQMFWLAAYPADVVKQRVMTDPLGGGLGDGRRRFRSAGEAAREVWRAGGARGFWRGFGPCFLRAFPANAVALVAFEGVMRGLPE